MRFIILHLGVNVHRYFAVLMACQILYCFGVNRSVNEVGDICVPQLMWRYLKIKAIYYFAIVTGLFT